MTTRGTRNHGGALRFTAALALLALAACKHDAADPSITTVSSAAVEAEGPVAEISKTAKLASIVMQTNIYAAPNDQSKKIGYLRLGAIVARSDKSYGCPGGWYGVAPRGFVCIGKNAALETDSPLVKAASVRPDTSKPLPYAYGFVRAVAPMYLRLPSKEEALQTEFKLGDHLGWWNREGKDTNKADHLGAVIPASRSSARSAAVRSGPIVASRSPSTCASSRSTR